MIALRDVTLEIGGRPLLRGMNAHIAAGEFVAVLGRNGAGKTTLLRAIAGLHPVRRGVLALDGVRCDRLRPRDRAKRMAFVTGDETFFDALGVVDVVSIARFAHRSRWQWRPQPADAAAVDRALADVRMERFSGRLMATLSSGERQRIWIALGLAQETPVLLLDEPTSHLDVGVAHEILNLLRALTRRGKTVVCALHDINEALSYADKVALLGEERLLALASPDKVFGGPLLARTFGVEFERAAAILPVTAVKPPDIGTQHPAHAASAGSARHDYAHRVVGDLE